MATIPLFTSINYTRPKSYTEEALSTLSNYFYLGGTRATVIKGNEIQLENGKVSLKVIALKVASYILLFPITLTLLVIDSILRTQYHFIIINPSKNPNQALLSKAQEKESTISSPISVLTEQRQTNMSPLSQQSDHLSSEIIQRTKTVALSALKFIISEDIQYAKNLDSNLIFNTRKITLIGDGEEHLLTTDKTTEKFYSQLDILFQNKGKEEIRLNSRMPEKCNKALLNFLLNGRPSPTYCCVDFFTDSVGLYSNSTVNSIDLNQWRMQDLDEASLNTGDGIIIFNKDQKPVHFAIYLTNDIYLSLAGTTGPLIATNLNEMKICFRGISAYRLHLKES